MNGVYSEFAEEGLNSKKYIVYEKLNKIGGGKSFDNAKDACKYAKEILADYGFTMFKDNGETWEEREGFVKLIFNKKTGEKDFVRFK